jgi:hypothetical protein
MAFIAAALIASMANAQKKYDPGASDREIKIGNIMPYSGPASAYGVIGKTEEAFFKMINAEGGINGRKINFISYDDAYSPPKAIEQARKLVEGDEVLLIFQSLGHAVQFGDHEIHERQEGTAAVRGVRRHQVRRPQEFPVDHGLSAELPERGANLRQIHPRSFPDQQDRGVLAERRRRQGSVQGAEGWARRQGQHDHRRQVLRGERSLDRFPDRRAARSGADIFFSWAAPKGSAQAIRKVGELGWKPKFFLANTATSVASVLKPAGLEFSKGIISTVYLKDPTDPTWNNDPPVQKWRAFMDKYYPDGDKTNANNLYGYVQSEALVQVLNSAATT